MLYILFNEDKKILLIAPTYDQTSILRNYIGEFLLKNDIFINMLDIEMSGVERIKREVSKKRMTFKNGCELRILSAEGEAKRLMGFGGDMIICDEDCLIDYEVYRQKISRMRGDNPNSILISIGNPWNRDNQMWQHWNDDKFNQIHIGWEDGVKEERITKEFINEQKETLTKMEFDILYKANFPEESEDSLFRWKWLQKSKFIKISGENTEQIAGLDVAEMGMDLTVLTKATKIGNKIRIEEIYSWSKKDTMETVGNVVPHISKNTRIVIDAQGVGRGVYDRLKEKGYNVVAFKGGKMPIGNEERFHHLKDEQYFKLRDMFEQDMISLKNVKNERKLFDELMKIKYGGTSTEKIKVIKPDDKSPDFADSLMMCCAKTEPEFLFDFV